MNDQERSEFQRTVDAAAAHRRAQWPTTDLATLPVTERTRTVTEQGIELPYVKQSYGTAEVIERGTVFVTVSTLEQVSEQGAWDSQVGGALLLDEPEGLALEQAGLAVRETRGGYHGTDALRAWWDTVTF